MNEEESKILFKWLDEHFQKMGIEKAMILNIGSGDEKYYTVSQPNIQADLIGPLINKGHTLQNLDIKEGPGIHITSEIHKIGEPDKKYDAIIFSSVIEHINPDHIPASIAQMRRVLKDDGIIVASAPASYPKHDIYDNGIRIHELEQWESYFQEHLWEPLIFHKTAKIPPKSFYKDYKDMTWMTMWKGRKYNPSCTVICLNWKRPENMEEVMNGISNQTINCKSFIWDNSGKGLNIKPHYKVISSHNFESKVKNILPLLIDTEYVLFQDDDLMLHPKTVEVMIDCCKRYPESVICLKYGVMDSNEYIASNYSSTEKPIDFTVGRVMLMRTELAGASLNPEFKEMYDIGEEDLCLGLAVQMFTKKPAYVVPIQSCRPIELADHDGRCHRSYHYRNRTKTINMFKELGWVSNFG